MLLEFWPRSICLPIMIGRFCRHMGDESRQGRESCWQVWVSSAVALMLVAVGTTGSIAVWSLIFCGLAKLHHVSDHLRAGHRRTGTAASKRFWRHHHRQCSGAVIPPLFGALAVAIGYQHAFILPIICYLYVLFMACGYSPAHVKA